jgi:hypothetical protein
MYCWREIDRRSHFCIIPASPLMHKCWAPVKRRRSDRRRYAGALVEAIANADRFAVGYSADVSG